MSILSQIHPTKPPNTGAPEYPDADDLSRRADLREIAAQLWGQPAKHHAKYDQHRARWRAGDDTPSFTVYADGFKDFGGDGESGDVYNFLQRELNKSYSEAIAWLSRYLDGATVHTASRHAAPVTAHNEPPAAAQQQEARRLIAECQRRLWSDTDAGHAALDYLHGRGLNDETIRARGYGLNPDWARSSYRNPDTGKLAKLAPGITIPYELDGVVWALRVRTLPQFNGLGLDKYMSFPGSKFVGTLYGGDGLEAGCNVLFVEGEFDCAIAQQELGDGITVVTLGGAGSHLARRWQERLQAAGQVYALLDNDAAGQQATARLVGQLPNLTALHLPTGKDVTEYVQSGGDLRAWFSAATAPDPEPTAATVEMLRGLYFYGTDSDPILWEIVCAGRAAGIIPTINEPVAISFDDLERSAEAAGFSIDRKTLTRYANGSGIILHPVDKINTGCIFVLNTIESITATLERCDKVEQRVQKFRAEPVDRTDPATGKTYTLPAVAADLEAQAFEDAGLSAPDAANAANLLANPTFDEPMRRLRQKASKRAHGDHAAFCQRLRDPRVIVRVDSRTIRTVGDLKRSHARAWHMAGLEGFQTVREQMRSLGIRNKNTLYAILAAAGIERKENIIPVTLQDGDLKAQIATIWREQKASPKAYKVVDNDTGEFERKPYSLEAIEADRKHATVIVECQAPNLHHVVELPPAREESRPRKPIASAEEKAKSTSRKQQTPRGHYPLVWVIGQLRLRYQLLHKREAPTGATVRELIAALIPDPILATAFDLPGVVIRKVG